MQWSFCDNTGIPFALRHALRRLWGPACLPPPPPMHGDPRHAVPLPTHLLAALPLPPAQAPEVFKGHMMKASDVYSFGVVLWQMVCGTGERLGACARA